MSQRVKVLFTRADKQNMVSLKEDELKKLVSESDTDTGSDTEALF